MSFSSSGGTLTVPSPTHAHHVDMPSAVRTLRRSLSRSPSAYNLAPTPSPSSDNTGNCQNRGRSNSSAARSQFHRYMPAAPSASTQEVNLTSSLTFAANPSRHLFSTTPPTSPSTQKSTQDLHALFSTPSRPNIKLSLRSAKSAKFASVMTSRPFARLRSSPKSPPVRRGLGVATDAGNAAPASSATTPSTPCDAMGQENHSPFPARHTYQHDQSKPSRHSVHLDFTGASAASTTPEATGSPVPHGTGTLKRSDADMMNVDPAAKRRSLHGIADLGDAQDLGIFDWSPSTHPPSFEIHDESNREYSLTGTAPRDPVASPTHNPASTRRSSSSLRKSTLQHRHGDRSSWGKRTGAQHLAQLGAEPSTPVTRNRPRLSLDQVFQNPISRESPFSQTGPLPNPSLHPIASHSTRQPHNLSKTAFPDCTTPTTSSPFGDSAQNLQSHALPASRFLPRNVTRKPAVSTPTLSFSDDFARPRPNLFMSTGLVSKVNRDPEDDKRMVVPDTPCKRNTAGSFATYPPIPGSAASRQRRSIFGSYTKPTAPATPGHAQAPGRTSSSSSSSPDIESPDKLVSTSHGALLFQRMNSARRRRRSGLFGHDGEIKLGADIPDGSIDDICPDNEVPPTPTPTKQGLTPSLSNVSSMSEQSIESPSAVRTTILSRTRPSPLFHRGLSSNLELDADAPRTPQESVIPPDPSSLSISTFGRSSPADNGSLSAPATPTTGDRGQNRHLVTPVNAHGRSRIEVDECLLTRFSRVDPIGQGEFSTVFRVAYPKNGLDNSSPGTSASRLFVPPGSPAPGKAFAVKKSRHRYAGARDRELKLEEAQILHRLANADHVVKYFDSWEMDDYLYIKMEYCDEGSLDKFLGSIGTKGRLDDFRIWKIIHDLSLGLDEIHSAGFIHLDLKPANVLITFEGVLKIGDFGLATAWPALPNIDAEGDREYIGPEVLHGNFDKPADVFSLGLIALEIAANVTLPDNGPTWVALRSGDYSNVPSLTFGASSPMTSTSHADFPSTVGSPDFGTPKHRALRQPPSFMADPADPQSLDHLVRALTGPKASERPTIQQVLSFEALQWVASRRLCPATVYEGTWGPDIVSINAFDCDVQMMDI